MKPTHACSSDIITQALALDILCRPVHSSRVGCGEALEVSKDLFWRVNADGHRDVFSPSPEELTQTWELTTFDLIRQEWAKACEDPW